VFAYESIIGHLERVWSALVPVPQLSHIDFKKKVFNTFLNIYKFIPIRMLVLILFLILSDIGNCGEQCYVIVRVEL
jgi:hypothetical protein